MKCVICKNGNTNEGLSTVTFERDDATIVFKDVPSLVCENCGEIYLDEKTTKELMKIANQIIKSGAQVDIRKFQAVA